MKNKLEALLHMVGEMKQLEKESESIRTASPEELSAFDLDLISAAQKTPHRDPEKKN